MVDHTRHIGLFSPIELPIRLIGCGGIGAMTAVVLSKMSDGPLYLYDHDNVEDINIATQLFATNNVGFNKAYATANSVNLYSDTCVAVHYPTKYPTAFANPAWLVISGVDSINSRKDIWIGLINESSWKWYIDARMGAEKFEMYIIDNTHNDILWYDKLLSAQTDDNIPDEPCTAKATFYTAAIAAGHIGKTVKKIANGVKPPHWLCHDIINDKLMVANGYKIT